MDQIKDAFQKVKQDIEFLKEELDFLKKGLIETRDKLAELCDIIMYLNKNLFSNPSNQQKALSTIPTHSPTDVILNSTVPTHSPTDLLEVEGLKPKNLMFSTGNEGVPTDKQTNRQTDKQTDKSSYNLSNSPQNNPIDDAAKLLESLDNIKKEMRLKFKRLTEQEITVFSTLYQLEEELGEVNYKTLASKLHLTESSIRDYIGRLIKKGIPVEKTKINNKSINLSISPRLKKIATLNTILQLRYI